MKPIPIVKASKQYLYTDTGREYLDCISHFAIVGHNHPRLMAAQANQRSKLSTAHGFHNDILEEVSKILTRNLPESLSVCYMLNSESEANDLALRMAKNYTKKKNILVYEGCTHGSIGLLKQLHSDIKVHEKKNIYTIPVPDLYNGSYKDDDSAEDKYMNDATAVINACIQKKDYIAAFISESIITTAGVIQPTKSYIARLHRLLQESGVLWISDETKIGLARTGDHMWAFEAHGIIPDIVTIGRQIGNGFPAAAVVTTKEIASCLGEYFSTYGGNPIACVSCMTLFTIIHNESLFEATKAVGRTVKRELLAIQQEHLCVGQIRGAGLCVGVEIVVDRTTREPSSEYAHFIINELRDSHNVLMDCVGPRDNVLLITPPLCFTQQNARDLTYAIKQAIELLEKTFSSSPGTGLPSTSTPGDDKSGQE